MADHRQAVRAALIPALTHAYWPTIRQHPLQAGEHLADEIRQHLNAKVDEIHRHYAFGSGGVFPAEPPNPAAQRQVRAPIEARFLAGQAPAAGAPRVRPVLGNGARGTGNPIVPGMSSRPTSQGLGRD